MKSYCALVLYLCLFAELVKGRVGIVYKGRPLPITGQAFADFSIRFVLCLTSLAKDHFFVFVLYTHCIY